MHVFWRLAAGRRTLLWSLNGVNRHLIRLNLPLLHHRVETPLSRSGVNCTEKICIYYLSVVTLISTHLCGKWEHRLSQVAIQGLDILSTKNTFKGPQIYVSLTSLPPSLFPVTLFLLPVVIALLKAHSTMLFAEYNVLDVSGQQYQSGQSHLYQSVCIGPTDLALVLNQFFDSWRHYDKQPPGRIIRIIQIQPPYHVHERYYEYRFVRFDD